MRWVVGMVAIATVIAGAPGLAEADGSRLVVLDLKGERVDTASLDYLSAQLRSESLRWIQPGWLMMGRPTAELRESGADQGITGVVSWDGRMLTMKLQRVDVRSGAVLANAVAKGRSLSALVGALPRASHSLLAPPSRTQQHGPEFEFAGLPPLPIITEPREL